MGLLDRPIRNGFDGMFDCNRDGVLDSSEMDAQECFLHDADTYNEFLDEDMGEDDFEDSEWDDEFNDENW